MKRTFRLSGVVLLILASVVFLVACGGGGGDNNNDNNLSNAIIGSWAITSQCDKAGGINFTEIFTFNSDNTVIYQALYSNNVKNEVCGTYVVNNDLLTFDFVLTNLEDPTLCYQETGQFTAQITHLSSTMLTLKFTNEGSVSEITLQKLIYRNHSLSC